MDRFHTPSPPGGTVRTLDGMRLSALRLPFLWRMILVRKPDNTFRDHARIFVVRFVVTATRMHRHRENDCC
jgi:hypothetical protein